MLMLTISTDEQHTSRSTNAQSSGPAPLARFAADIYPASPQPEQCLQPWVTTAPALSSCPINKTFAPPAVEFQEDRWAVFCLALVMNPKIIMLPGKWEMGMLVTSG